MKLCTLNLLDQQWSSTVEFANIPSSTDPSIEVESMAERVVELHKDVIEHSEKMNVKYKTEANQHRKFK